MQLQIPVLPDHISAATYCATAIIVAVAVILIWRASIRPNLDKFPTVGSNTWLGSWWAGVTFLVDATNVIQQSYDKYKGIPFRVSTFHRWMVIVSGRVHVEEFRKFHENELSFIEAAGDTLEAEHTLGRDTHHNPYHVAILRAGLNRNLSTLYPDIRDEIVTAFDDTLKLEGHDWKSVPALSTIQHIVCRTSNRVLVGLPLCRDSDWVDLNIQFTLDVIKGAAVISLFPKWMAPLVTRLMTNIPGSNRRCVKHLSPIVEARQKYVEAHGTPWSDKPNDLLSWLMDGSDSSQRHVSNMSSRILSMNFAAIHTSSNSFTQALYNLAANPQYIEPLREEVESIVQEQGWSRAAVERMYNIDSFMKESQRMDGIGLVNMVRKAMKDVTFSDGTVIPKGTFVAVATQLMHRDSEFYEDADLFDPFRFARMRGEDGGGVKHQLSTTSPEYLVFGHGRHACPGRFFAASMLNTMLAHIVVSYDIKLEDNATRPQNLRIGTAIAANPTARVMLRRRVA